MRKNADFQQLLGSLKMIAVKAEDESPLTVLGSSDTTVMNS